MRKFKLLTQFIFVVLMVIPILQGCKKGLGDYNYVNQTLPFNGTVYDYLKSQPGVFDSLLFCIDKLKLADTLKNNNITLFACTNPSFQQVVAKLNVSRKLLGNPPVYLNDMTPNLLDSLVCRYIIRGKYTADSLAYSDGRMIRGVRYGYPMNGKLSSANATGYIAGGPSKLVFSYTKRSLFTRDWVQANANAINISTSNGVVHVLESTHPFGFGEYIKPASYPFTLSPFRPAGYIGAFPFPSTVGGTSLIEAEDYDYGGEGLAYHDNEVKNNGGNYRPNEGVDIDVPYAALTAAPVTDAAGTYPSSYSIGWTATGEWTVYSINVPVEGDFVITTRAGNASTVNPLKFHIEFDSKNVTGSLTYPNNKGWWVWQLVPSPSIHLTAGLHLMKFYWETADVQVNNFAIKRVN